MLSPQSDESQKKCDWPFRSATTFGGNRSRVSPGETLMLDSDNGDGASGSMHSESGVTSRTSIVDGDSNMNESTAADAAATAADDEKSPTGVTGPPAALSKSCARRPSGNEQVPPPAG